MPPTSTIRNILPLLLLLGLGRSEAARPKRALQPVADNAYRQFAAESSGCDTVTLYSWRKGTFAVYDVGSGPTLFLLTADYATPRGYRGPASVAVLVSLAQRTLIEIRLVETTLAECTDLLTKLYVENGRVTAPAEFNLQPITGEKK